MPSEDLQTTEGLEEPSDGMADAKQPLFYEQIAVGIIPFVAMF